MSLSEHFRPALTVDCAVFGWDGGELRVLLVRRGLEPFAGWWALPGGFVRPGESLEDAARRELAEETGVEEVYLEQLYTFGDPDRDPRERVVTVAYYALVRGAVHPPEGATDAVEAAWFDVARLPQLAFDHGAILEVARRRLQAKVRYEPVGFELLPPSFTLTQLQRLYEAVLGRELDKRNFRKKLLKLALVEPTGEVQQGVPHRAAKLYRFHRERYSDMRARGIDFEL